MVSERDLASKDYDFIARTRVRIGNVAENAREFRKSPTGRNIETVIVAPAIWFGALGYFAGSLAIEGAKPVVRKIRDGVSHMASDIVERAFNESDEAHAHIESGFGVPEFDSDASEFDGIWPVTDHAILAGDAGTPIKDAPIVENDQISQRQIDAHPGYNFRPSRGPTTHDGGPGLA